MTSAARYRRSAAAIRLPGRGPAPAITPLSLLSSALDRGVDEHVLSQLIDLHERGRADDARRAFEAGLTAAKAELPVIAKTQIASIGSKHYRHEDLAEIARAIGPILAQHGLAYRFRSNSDGERVTITCVISHRDGHSEENSLSAGADHSGDKNPIQAIGSTLTYLQRMTLKAALGLAAADDDDGKAAGAAETITRQQTRELLALIDEVGGEREALLRFFKIKALAELPARRFRQALVMLNAKKGRA
ncbi:MAG: ERF family protein [Bosea sp. (in: a-proteobacteria)]|uniref:ERF family protein n=1 Tax=Bosea sp. (in: a-proteobacteria) TaxID=1871050 RepID=UPI003F7C57CD